MKKVAIILVNWNGKKYLKDCLNSLARQTYQNFDIFFIDNNSKDDSLDLLRNYERVTIIKNTKNYGFAKGNNIGIEKALKNGYKYIVLVNLDTIVDKSWLENLVNRAEKDPRIGAVQSKILLNDSKRINTTGSQLHFLGFSYCDNYNCKDNFHGHEEIPLFSGCSVLISSNALQEAGLFDESFFMYFEDADLSWRIKQLGYKIIFEPTSVIYHKYSFSKNKNKFYYAERNRLIFILKNYELKTIILITPAFIITEIIMIGYSLLNGWLVMKLKGYAFISKNLKNIISKRVTIKKKRLIKDKELKKYFTYRLHFEEITSPIFIPLNLFFRLYWFIVRSFI